MGERSGGSRRSGHDDHGNRFFPQSKSRREQSFGAGQSMPFSVNPVGWQDSARGDRDNHSGSASGGPIKAITTPSEGYVFF